MKILNSKQIREADQYTIQNEPISSIDLMERASYALSNLFQQLFKDKTIPICIFAGSGNNGGDALALARMLAVKHYNVNVYILDKTKGSDDFETNLKRLSVINPDIITKIKTANHFPFFENETIIVDGIFGSGLNRAIEGVWADLIDYINSANKTVFAIDIPSGLFCDDNQTNTSPHILKATYTVSFQFQKFAFLLSDNAPFIGELFVKDIRLLPGAIDKAQTNTFLIDEEIIIPILKRRDKFSHKGTFGHALLIAGSYGKMGAAVLAAQSCLRSGAGLLTAHVPHWGYNIIQTASPETMVSIDQSEMMFTTLPDLSPYNAIGIGPGLGTKQNTSKGLKELFTETEFPLVIDADALNIISAEPELLRLIPQNSILTPHPGEFDRLTGKSTSHHERINKQIEFSKTNGLILVLKGANTTISTPDGKLFFNSTGNPGMATAGCGDVLTGIILGLLAQSYTPEQAAICGVYIHGMAGDLAILEQSEHSLIARDITNNLGAAYREIQND